MNHDRTLAGAVSVGAMDAVPAQHALLISCLREWFAGPEGPPRVHDILRFRLGGAVASGCLSALEEVFGLLAARGRRPLVHHRAGCRCVSADEAVFANFVTLAATGEREDALLIASLLVDGTALLPLTEAARQAGLQMLRAGLQWNSGPAPASVTRH